MKRFLPLLVLLSATACTTVDDVRAMPPRFTVTVSASWDKVGACLASAYTNDFEAVYLPVQSEQRAELVLNMVSPSNRITIAVFDIRGGNSTMVTLRRAKMVADLGGQVQQARDLVARCGAG